jgi:biotin carboxyl carrier protein
MDFSDIARLVHRLEAGNLTACEFDDNGNSSLRLRFGPAGSPPTSTSKPASATASVAAGTNVAASRADLATVHAPRFGIYLHRHPLSDTGGAEAGQSVQVGEIVGFIQAGEAVVPVRVTRAGTLHRTLVDHGTLVGYGQPLVELI